MRVAVVLVTYNRSHLLEGAVRAIINQTLEPMAFYVIDNNSSDATAKIIADLSEEAPNRISYVKLHDNLGGAGGFRAGLELARNQTAADWFWLLDDDVVAQPDCLENLSQYAAMSECVHPLVIYQDGDVHLWEHLFEPHSTFQVGLMNQSFRNGKDWCSMRVACFEGMLVSRRITDITGLPDADFFVYGDDGQFGFVASLYTNILYVKNAVLVKMIKPNHAVSPFKIYYDIRNRFLLRNKLKDYIEPQRFGRVLFVVFLFFHTKVLLRGNLNWKNIRAAWFGWLDGARLKVGRRRY